MQFHNSRTYWSSVRQWCALPQLRCKTRCGNMQTAVNLFIVDCVWQTLLKLILVRTENGPIPGTRGRLIGLALSGLCVTGCRTAIQSFHQTHLLLRLKVAHPLRRAADPIVTGTGRVEVLLHDFAEVALHIGGWWLCCLLLLDWSRLFLCLLNTDWNCLIDRRVKFIVQKNIEWRNSWASSRTAALLFAIWNHV